MKTAVLPLGIPETSIDPPEASEILDTAALEGLRLMGTSIGTIAMGNGICPHPNKCVFSGCDNACK